MSRLIRKLSGLHSRTEAEEDWQDADPLPVILKGIAVLIPPTSYTQDRDGIFR